MKVAIVELSKSHEECIYTQISFLLKDNNNISLILHPSIKKQISYINLVDHITTINFDELRGLNSLKNQLKLVKKLASFDKVIFNTASSSKQLRNIVFMLLLYKVECIGLIHNIKKLKTSFTQKIISLKIKKYFILSDFLKQNAEISSSKIKLESFYPIFFPDFKRNSIKKQDNELWLCIPGRVEFGRRNYFFLINQLQNNSLPKNIKFIILGNINTKDGLEFKAEVDKLNLNSSFVFFDKFISNDLFYSCIEKSDYILPLLNKEDDSYLKHKISGTFNLAFAFKKTLFCNEFYKQITDLNENGVFYSNSNFAQKLLLLKNKNHKNSYKNIKWNYDFQFIKFINFINNRD